MLHRNPEAQVSLERTCRVRSGTSRVFGWQNRQCPFAKGLTFVVRMPADYQNQLRRRYHPRDRLPGCWLISAKHSSLSNCNVCT